MIGNHKITTPRPPQQTRKSEYSAYNKRQADAVKHATKGYRYDQLLYKTALGEKADIVSKNKVQPLKHRIPLQPVAKRRGSTETPPSVVGARTGVSRKEDGIRLPVRRSNDSNSVPTNTPSVRSKVQTRSNMEVRKTRCVGHYVLGETLGEGTFGKVKRGSHTLTGEHVAVKILEKSKIKTEADLVRVTREIKILKRVRNDNCIRLLEVIDTPQQIFLMMEYLNGGELFDYIVHKSRLPEPEASHFFSQILDGVDYLHKSNVIHRDLKPENLLLQRNADGSRTIKVADFGLSNTNEESAMLKTACGSPCYAAPEMIAGKLYDGTKSDVWSLGVVLFALICGFLPFEENDTAVLYRKILSANYKCPRFVSIEAQDLLSKILETNPEKRFSIDMIRCHIWMRKHAALQTQDNQSQRTIKIEPDTPEEGAADDESSNASDEIFNERVIDSLVELGLDRDHVVKSLIEKVHNNATASYFLISEKRRKDDEKRAGAECEGVVGKNDHTVGPPPEETPSEEPEKARRQSAPPGLTQPSAQENTEDTRRNSFGAVEGSVLNNKPNDVPVKENPLAPTPATQVDSEKVAKEENTLVPAPTTQVDSNKVPKEKKTLAPTPATQVDSGKLETVDDSDNTPTKDICEKEQVVRAPLTARVNPGLPTSKRVVQRIRRPMRPKRTSKPEKTSIPIATRLTPLQI